MMSPAVSAGSELSGLKPQVLVVTSGTLTPCECRCAIMSTPKLCSRSFRKSFDGPCSHERQVLSFGSPLAAANASARALKSAACLGTFLSGRSQLPKCCVTSFSLVMSIATTAGSSL